MADFEGAEPLILDDEGVESRTPGDDGGRTIFGIDQASNPTWPGLRTATAWKPRARPRASGTWTSS